MPCVCTYVCFNNKKPFMSYLCRTPPETLKEVKHDLLSYCRHVAAGLSILSSKGFVHRDLAARNILVSSDDVCKVNMLQELWNTLYGRVNRSLTLEWLGILLMTPTILQSYYWRENTSKVDST